MSIFRRIITRARLTCSAISDPQGLARLRWVRAGEDYATRFAARSGSISAAPSKVNPLEAFFDARREGPGIWKWRHYFEVYHRHFAKFVGCAPVVLEIGIYSGGSLDMWRDYFGEAARVFGVDIEPACKSYERPGVSVVIGDQGDREFWRRALADGTVPAPDVVIDDGSHFQEHQRITLEELLPQLRPGGVYVCEDVVRRGSHFAAFVHGLADCLNAMDGRAESPSGLPTTSFQSAVHSIHFYPFMVVIERHGSPPAELVSEKRGTQWQPFFG